MATLKKLNCIMFTLHGDKIQNCYSCYIILCKCLCIFNIQKMSCFFLLFHVIAIHIKFDFSMVIVSMYKYGLVRALTEIVSTNKIISEITFIGANCILLLGKFRFQPCSPWTDGTSTLQSFDLFDISPIKYIQW